MRPPKALTIAIARAFHDMDVQAGKASPTLTREECAQYIIEAAYYTTGLNGMET